jgi:hypothetical protein
MRKLAFAVVLLACPAAAKERPHMTSEMIEPRLAAAMTKAVQEVPARLQTDASLCPSMIDTLMLFECPDSQN